MVPGVSPVKRPFLVAVPGHNGTRWLAGWGNTIHWAWTAPRWLAWLTFRLPNTR